MGRVNIFRQVLTENGWRNAALDRDDKGRIKWPSRARFLIEWRESGKRKREAAGETPSEALEAQRRKRLELEARATGLTVTDPEEEEKAAALTPHPNGRFFSKGHQNPLPRHRGNPLAPRRDRRADRAGMAGA